MAIEKALIGGERRCLKFIHVALHGEELICEAVERLDQQEIRDVRVHDAPSLSLKFLQRVGVEIAPYLLARDRVLKNDARLIASVFAFAGHNKTPPKIHCGIIPEGVIYFVLL